MTSSPSLPSTSDDGASVIDNTAGLGAYEPTGIPYPSHRITFVGVLTAELHSNRCHQGWSVRRFCRSEVGGPAHPVPVEVRRCRASRAHLIAHGTHIVGPRLQVIIGHRLL